jgi:predicted HicB family RNase H-like nuclease
MKDVLIYKDFIGSVHFSTEDKVFHGKIEGITDLVTFEGRSVNELEKAFHEAVNDYLALCKEAGKEPLKSCKGSFNVRIPYDLHIKALKQATITGISLNQLVQKAIEKAVTHEDMQKTKDRKRTKEISLHS